MPLTQHDRDMLEGCCGEGKRLAMSIIVRMTEVLEVEDLLDISQAHIDGTAC